MKNITLSIPEDVYRRARIVAAERNQSLSALVRGFLESLPTASPSHQEQVAPLLAALDRSRNKKTIGPLQRDELHDRNALH